MSKEDFIWPQKYRPKKISECILPKELKDTFQSFVDKAEVPNLLLAGNHGVGKTTVAKAMLNEIGADSIIINGSLRGNIDTLRTEIMNYASSVSLEGNGRKYVILDEADYLNSNSTQPALRNFMEEYSKNCGFILTCNYKNKIIGPLQSRCSLIDFNKFGTDKKNLMVEFANRCFEILEKEGIEFNKKAVVGLIKDRFPDFRRTLNDLQRYSHTGKIDAGVIHSGQDVNFETLLAALKDKNFDEVRTWVAHNSELDFTTVARKLYDEKAWFDKNSLPNIPILANEYAYKSAFVVDQEINTTAFLVEIMIECKFK